MTISFSYLVGDFEQPSETLRKLVFDNWLIEKTNGIKPRLISPQGFDGDEAGKDDTSVLSTNDWLDKKKNDIIRFRVTDHTQQKPEDCDNSNTRKNYIVQIDVFATNEYLASLFREMIDDIFFDKFPTTSRRLSKSDGRDSGIVTFDRLTIEWTEIGAFETAGQTHEWQGEIGCLFQKNKT